MPAEATQIKATGKLENIYIVENKYFSATRKGAEQFASMAEKGFGNPPYEIIETKIPKKLLEALPEIQRTTVDSGIPTVIIPTESLDILSKPEFLDRLYTTFKPKP